MTHPDHRTTLASGAQVSKLLQFNPDKRITAEEALAHPYVAQFHNEADEPSHPTPITIPIDDNHKVAAARVAHWWP